MKVFKLGGSDGDAVYLDDRKEKLAAYKMVEAKDGKEESNESVPLNPETIFQATFHQADLLLERVDKAEHIEKEDSEKEKREMKFARLWNRLVSETPFDEFLYCQKKTFSRQADLWLLRKQVDYFCQSKLPVCMPEAFSSSTSTTTTSSSFFPHCNSILTPTFLLESVAARSQLRFSISFVLLLQLFSIRLLATL